MDIEKKRAFIINVLFFTCIFGLLYIMFKYVLVWMLPFIIGFFVALLLQRPINAVIKLTHWKKKVVSPILTFFLVALVAFGISAVFYNAGEQIASLVSKLPALYESTAPVVLDKLDALGDSVFKDMSWEVENTIRGMLESALSSLQSWIVNFTSKALGALATAATGIPGMLVAIIITIVSSFFMSTGFDDIKGFVMRQVPVRYRNQISNSWHTFGKTVVKMLWSYAFIMFVTFVELAIGLSIYRVSYAVLLAALISLVDILPVLGVGTVLIPWGVILLILGDTWMGAKILLLYLLITVVRNFLEPKIIGDRIGLSPLVTLIFMYFGLKLMGLLGMFLLPLTLILINDAQKAGAMKIWKTAADEERTAAGRGSGSDGDDANTGK